MSSASQIAHPDTGVDASLDELSSLLWETFRNLKQSSPPPRELREAADRGSLAPRHMPALLALAVTGPSSVSELAHRLGLELSTTSAITGQLARAGLVERSEDDADRRRTIVGLHPAHSDAMAVWAEQAIAPLRRTLERLSPAARVQFLEGWRILHEEAARAPRADADQALCT